MIRDIVMKTILDQSKSKSSPATELVGCPSELPACTARHGTRMARKLGMLKPTPPSPRPILFPEYL